jgi:acetolactate synthase-like protein
VNQRFAINTKAHFQRVQDIDQQALLKPHVKWMAHVSCVADIVPIMEQVCKWRMVYESLTGHLFQAFKIAQSGTPGPVFIEFPVDVIYPENFARKWFADS